jgi:hypothetical protein
VVEPVEHWGKVILWSARTEEMQLETSVPGRTGCGDVLRAAGVADDKIRWVQKCGAVRTLQFNTTIVLYPVEDRTKTSLLGFVSKID